MPMSFGHMNNDWNQQREGITLVCLQDIEEVIVLEKAHSSVSNLQV